jgi:hypothetical protein
MTNDLISDSYDRCVSGRPPPRRRSLFTLSDPVIRSVELIVQPDAHDVASPFSAPTGQCWPSSTANLPTAPKLTPAPAPCVTPGNCCPVSGQCPLLTLFGHWRRHKGPRQSGPLECFRIAVSVNSSCSAKVSRYRPSTRSTWITL